MPAISQDIFNHIRRIQIRTTRLVEDLFAGAYHSIFKGRGIEFEEVRAYVPGDDIRTIDWNVTARMNHPYVKNFKEERELTVILVVDISSSSRFGSTNRSKSELIAEIGAVLAFSAIKNHDKIGLLLFSTVVEKYIPPKKGIQHVLRTIRELLVYEPRERGTDINAALSFLHKIQKRTAICFLISDYLCSDYTQAITLTAKRYDLISIGVTDPFEVTFPDLSLTHLSDLETGESQLIDTANPILQRQFQEKAAARLTSHQRLMQKIGAGYIPIRTDQPYVEALWAYFKRRGKKR